MLTKTDQRTLQPHLSNKLQLLHYQIFWQRENSPERIPLETLKWYLQQETAVKIIANNISLFTKVFRFMKAFTQLQCSYTDVTGWNSMASMKIGNVEEYRKRTGRKMKHPFSLHTLLKWGMGLRSG